MSSGNIGVGTTVKWNTSQSFTTPQGDFDQVRSFGGLTEEAAEVDITNFGSTGNAREFIAGLIDPGEAEMELVFLDGDLTSVYSIFRTTKWWQVNIDPSGTNKALEFQGFIKSINWEIPVDDAIVVNLSLRVTGDVSYGAPSA